MADYTTINLQYNSGAGTDASPVWTGTAIALSGSAGANELRMALSTGSQTTSTSSANWPYMSRPASGTSAIDRLYAFTADTTGLQITTYDGTNGKARVIRWNFDNTGNPITAMQVSCYGDNTHAAPSAGTQPPASHNDPWTNGQTSDTSNTSYIKGNCYGSGLTAGGSQETPSAGTVGTTYTATTGSAGAATPSAGAWLTTWQSLQGGTQYLQGPATPQTATAFDWYQTLVIYFGVNISTGSYTLVYTLTYTYS